MAHNSLPVRKNLARRGIKLDTICPVCQRLDEDCSHLFFKCKGARACWKEMDLGQVRTELEACQSGQETITRIWTLDQNVQNKVFGFSMIWWSARNKANVGEGKVCPAKVCKSITLYLMEFAKMATPPMSLPQSCSMGWKSMLMLLFTKKL
jgi:hypothetical protein